MSYRSLRHCVNDLERTGQLVRIKAELDPNLEIAEIHRRVYDAGGPALLFERVKGSPFQAVSNLYGTFERTEYIFRDTIKRVQKVIELKVDPTNFFKKPTRYLGAPFTALKALPMRRRMRIPVAYGETTIDQLPQIKSWPMDSGAFVTLPQVYTEDPEKSGVMGASNLGMYRIQLSGNDYIQNEEIGLHYQIHRGIGVHHEKYNRMDKPFKASVFVGGLPSHAFSAIMPLPEGLTELTFAGMLAGRRFGYARRDGHVLSADADFCITGEIIKDKKKLEGPFGDHTGYYNEVDHFPCFTINTITERDQPIYHTTYTGRPPDEPAVLGVALNEVFVPILQKQFPEITDFYLPPEGCSYRLAVVSMKKQYPGHAKRVMLGIWSFLRQFMLR